MYDDSYILIKMHRINARIDRATARIAAVHGLTLSQFGVLEALYHSGDMTVGEVRDHILSSDGTIPVVVRNLEKRGLVSRREDERDHRRHILSLTEEGRKLIATVYPENERMIEQQMSVWTSEEKRRLSALLRKFGTREDAAGDPEA
ncbi:MAG: MarR family winged helix-turn-helix transcriptional regulator [Tractidigestivibacter sp.]|uniref:MarR family winged helix-turn-helix transcriptional regulator n=1 Tax=Tractidigestivibacter sp. TaxID=2847320 RepID=UPI003D93F3AE